MPAPVKNVDWRCPQCGRRRWLKPGVARQKKFCSRACYFESNKKPEEERVRKKPSAKKTFGIRQCNWCHNDYTANTAHQLYCGYECSRAYMRSKRAGPPLSSACCEYCGEEYKPRRNNVGRFCSRACWYKGGKGDKAAHWRGGRYISAEGYVRVITPTGEYVPEHRVVMEKIVGRPLERYETVHHINGDKQDNLPENLELWSSRHVRGTRVKDQVTWARETLSLYGHLFPKET